MFNGLEIDVLSLGDADCSIVTQWHNGYAQRVLIDGGCPDDAEKVIDFLRGRGYTNFSAAVCTHAHDDHAGGLLKVVQSPFLTFRSAWLHDITQHVSPDMLRRACADDEGVGCVVDTTRALSDAFRRRGIPVGNPVSGVTVAMWPHIVVLGPSQAYYSKTIAEFANTTSSSSLETSPMWQAMASVLGGAAPPETAPLTGLLAGSSVKIKPQTQPYNNTSVILGVRFGDDKMLLTADAGAEALRAVSPDWNHLTYLGVPHHGSDGNLSQADIERFCPQFAVISAKGDSSHPSRSIVNGLVKVGAKVASTHRSGSLRFHIGVVPLREDYGPVEYLKGNVDPDPRAAWIKALAGAN